MRRKLVGLLHRWNWRNGDQTKITTNTRNLLINIDGLGDVFTPAVEAATKEVAEWLRTECQATIATAILWRACPEIQLELALRPRPWEPTEGW
jgi:DNA/RNA-binding domain of Phe-tRNA-synthetase-like protein